MHWGRTALGASALIALAAAGTPGQAETITIATVNNADMIIMQRLSPQWEQATGNTLNWVVLEENVLRQRVTTDIATQGGQFDVITIGSYEAPIWGKQGWLVRARRPGRRLRLRRPDPDGGQRPVLRRQALRGAVLCRELVHLLSQGPVRAGRHHDARDADLRPDRRVRRQAHRQVEGAVRLLPARQARLGREHGVRRADGERLRRPLVRRGVGAAAHQRALGRPRSPTTSRT